MPIQYYCADMKKKQIAAICGSTRSQSTNQLYLKAIEALLPESFELIEPMSIDQLPHFNPDMDNSDVPENVALFRNILKGAAAIIICTPEYAMGVPGSLKNAIDWTVSSCEFSHKPTALITASLSGIKAHAALLETLKVIEAVVMENTQLVIPFAKTKINSNATITDEATREAITSVIENLIRQL
jgi:NAD(P)H-dependent FMN reductase